ncbi:breast cancer anti-estrogen resistance protein 3 homolog [Schistocerca nitens]|uniref:breast cancer anti-estrogen resistance protein 3 homolog n=1 Tax=Schistocerca nitens TaxID=7011 RepID=UPI0021196FFB|nr:breast cancer anti-estrogen resistance protein 3 homolog [Schistocerca nitens]
MGKSGSKLRKKRSQSIAWSFRFPSLSSLSRRKMAVPPSRPHMDVRTWIEVLELTQYAALFEKFDGVEDLLTFSEEDIRDLGVKNSAHRARIVSSLVALRAKYEKSARRKDKPQRHSVAVEPSRLVQQNGTSDILVVSDVIQSKSLCNLVMEGVSSPGSSPGAGEVPGELRKALEWELSLDARDLRSHAWYHGAIPRQRAEDIVQRDGDFLVRDCSSQPGNYVLSCRCKGQPLHFVINKVVIQPDTVYERVQYQFEEDAYDTVPDLITYYVGSGKSVSTASGARISTPRNRLYPLSFYASKYGLQQQQHVSPLSSPGGTPALRYNPYNSYRAAPHSPPRTRRGDTPPRLPSKKQRSQSLTPADSQQQQQNHQQPAAAGERASSADGVIQTGTLGRHDPPPAAKFSTHSLPRSAGLAGKHQQVSPSSTPGAGHGHAVAKMVRVTSDPALSPCLERRRFGYEGDGAAEAAGAADADLPEQPPPKPSRVPSLPPKEHAAAAANHDAHHPPVFDNGLPAAASLQRVSSYHASGSDSGNGSGDSAQSSAADATDCSQAQPQAQHRGVVIKNPRYRTEYDSAAEDSLLLSVPEPEPPSAFDLESASTLLLPVIENKPLDPSALQAVRRQLQETGPRVLAAHLTRVDLSLLLDAADLGLGIACGLELVTLPHGRQLRLDLIERTECLKLLVAVTILTCTTEAERAESLNKWIEVAVETKTALGNLYGFCAVMMGLCMPQIQRLSSTWHVLRQKFTDSAFNFEAKLRPTLKSMNECTNPQAPNTTIPHLLPFLLLQDRTLEDILGPAPGSLSWETSTADLGLGTLLAHMEAARKFAESVPMFRRNAEIALGSAAKQDELLTDMFRTEFHLKFLWGSRGASVAADERRAKFEQVLAVMSDKCEPPA